MESMLQDLIVALLVPACAGYAGWKIMPAAARRALAIVALRWPAWPAAWQARLERATRPAGGACGCDGCDRRIAARPSASVVPQPVVIHRRKAVR